MRVAEQKQVREMTGPMGRPDGDHRSEEQIIEQSPVLKNLLENRDHYPIADDLKRQVGDWSKANPDPESRANAAYDLNKVLQFIDNTDDSTLSGSQSRNGKIDGFYDDGYKIQENSEASLLRDFSTKGYDVLRYQQT
jgi:hypothetical protein